MRGRTVGRVAPSIVETIGGTPTIELARLTRGLPGRIVAMGTPGEVINNDMMREVFDVHDAVGIAPPSMPFVLPQSMRRT